VMPNWSASRLPYHSATAKGHCPSSSVVARHGRVHGCLLPPVTVAKTLTTLPRD
jgi:hypothetical protein